MDPDASARHDRRLGRLARVLFAGVVAALTIVAFSPAASAADVGLGSVNVTGAKHAGKPLVFVVQLSGSECQGAAVTVWFDDEPRTRIQASKHCQAEATLTIPNPTSCHNGSGTVNAYAKVGSVTSNPIHWHVTCLKKPSPPKKPSKSPSPSPTPTHTKQASTHPPTHSPKASPKTPSKSAAPTKSASPTPSPSSTTPTPSSTNSTAVNPLLPPDDGGPQLPAGGGLTGSLTAVALIATGGAVGLLLWQRGAGLPTLAAVLGGALVLAAAAAVVPQVLGHQKDTGTTPVVQAATAQITIPAGKTASVTARCQSGTVVVGGGARTTGSRDVSLSTSAPTSSGWSATAAAPNGTTVTLTAVAVCATGLSAPTSHSDGPYAVDTVQAQRTQARCGGVAPVAVGWKLPAGQPLAVLPLATGGSVTAYAAPDASGSTVVLCAGSGYPTVQRTTSQPVQLGPGDAGRALATCPAGTVAVGGGYLPVSPADGRLAGVSVQSATPVDGGFQVTAKAALDAQGANLNAYALCLGSASH